ncbi:hypothetical protein YC2023_041286 [Brassica napus]
MSLRVPACPGRVPLSSIRPPPAPTWLSELQHVGPSWHCPPPVIIAIITPRLGIDSILWRHYTFPVGYCPAGHSHGYLLLGYCPVGSCGYLMLGYCSAGSHILDFRRPPVIGALKHGLLNPNSNIKEYTESWEKIWNKETRERRDLVTTITPHSHHHHHTLTTTPPPLGRPPPPAARLALGVTRGEERGRDPTGRERRERGVREEERKEKDKLDG